MPQRRASSFKSIVSLSYENAPKLQERRGFLSGTFAFWYGSPRGLSLSPSQMNKPVAERLAAVIAPLSLRSARETSPADPTGPRFRIEDIYPCVDGGRYPVKRIAGEPVEVWADIFREGHDVLGASLLWRAESEKDWHREPMVLDSNDRWRGSFTAPAPGSYLFAVESWTDQYATWKKGLLLK